MRAIVNRSGAGIRLLEHKYVFRVRVMKYERALGGLHVYSSQSQFWMLQVEACVSDLYESCCDLYESCCITSMSVALWEDWTHRAKLIEVKNWPLWVFLTSMSERNSLRGPKSLIEVTSMRDSLFGYPHRGDLYENYSSWVIWCGMY